ncbi:tumor necrosis factor receptor superfamily member 14-like isoform X5 [Myotis yumanensis]|uniref:tumor necrosis factor receptor superfamily member 14-like isoform X5 n=1 Tax=Myotis yumanensis TaxID=159337 RepID=UPI0038D1ED4D
MAPAPSALQRPRPSPGPAAPPAVDGQCGPTGDPPLSQNQSLYWTSCPPPTRIQALSLLLLTGPPCTLGKPSCKEEEFPTGAMCCPRCRPGSRVQEACGELRSTVCVACTRGTYTAHLNGLPECLRCRVCDPGTEWQDTLCEDCQPGTFSAGGTQAACTPWTRCSGPLAWEATPGTNSADVTCSSRGPIIIIISVSVILVILVILVITGISVPRVLMSIRNRTSCGGLAQLKAFSQELLPVPTQEAGTAPVLQAQCSSQGTRE